MTKPSIVLIVLAAAAPGCGSAAAASSPTTATAVTQTTTSTGSGSTSLPAMYGQFYGTQASLEGNVVVLRATSVPDHPSPYFGAGTANYEAPHAGMQVNPNRIVAQNMVLRIPVSPAVASASSDTPLGAMGVAVNGVALFNQYAAQRALTSEILSFDRYNGHPQQQGMYHYHIEPVYLTAQGSARLVGVLLDGFPVYGTRDSSGVTPSNLDACNGHVGATPEFPNGIYHYHIVANPPYIAGCFKGTPGTAS